jgi:hypothetical protein
MFFESLMELLPSLLTYPLGWPPRSRLNLGGLPADDSARKASTINRRPSGGVPMSDVQQCVDGVQSDNRDLCRSALARLLTISFTVFGPTKLVQCGALKAVVAALGCHAKQSPDVVYFGEGWKGGGECCSEKINNPAFFPQALLAVCGLNHMLECNPAAQEKALTERVLPTVLRLMTESKADPPLLQQCCLVLQNLCAWSADAAGPHAQTLVSQSLQQHLLASPELSEECAATLIVMSEALGTKAARTSAWHAHLQTAIKEAQSRLPPDSSALCDLLQAVTKAYKS